jgi:uncharacterized protein (UPF0332 family)
MKESEPNEIDYSIYRIQRAFETLKEVSVLVENEFWNASVNRMYYACFYSVGALLAIDKVRTSSHSGVKLKFGQLYVKTQLVEKRFGKFYSDLFEKRHKGDYNDFFDYDEETVQRFHPLAIEFVKKMNEILQEKLLPKD